MLDVMSNLLRRAPVTVRIRTQASRGIKDDYADVLYFLQHNSPLSVKLSLLAYVQFYATRANNHHMIEQLHATTCGFINALSVRTLLARFSATSSRPRGKLRTWIIDRHRIYRTLARVNGYHWDETD